jgi:DNA-binding MarR family transcriptional regulator
VDLSAAQRRTLKTFLLTVALAEPLQQELAASHGISLSDLHAVRLLSSLGEAPVSRYGAELGLPRSTITNLVDRLERAGLVERVASPTDRRVTLVRLTEAGREAVDARELLAESDVARRLFALDAADQAALVELLERILANRPEPDAATEGDPSDDSRSATAAELESIR